MSGLSREPDDHLPLTCEHLWPTCRGQVSPRKRGAQAGAGHSCRWTDAQEDPVPKPAGITQTITCRDLLGRHRQQSWADIVTLEASCFVFHISGLAQGAGQWLEKAVGFAELRTGDDGEHGEATLARRP